jgi:phosphate transport system substrate-binding protein
VQDAAVAEWVRAYRAACPAAPVIVVRAPAPAGREAVLGGQAQLAAAERPPAADPGTTGPGCPGGRLVGLPVLAAPVTVVHSLPGLPALTVTPAVLARVYLGEVTEWSDPEIAVANPGVPLPAAPITVLRPAPATAGTEALSRFLAAWEPDLWRAPPATTLPRGVAGTAVPDVAAAVRRTPGALGYLDGPVPGGRGVAVASVDTGSGAVAPTPATVRSAVARADVEGESPDVRVTVDPAADEPGSYPLALVGYQVTCDVSGSAGTASVERFLAYATGDAGQAALERLGYAPLPNGLRGRVRAAVDALAED